MNFLERFIKAQKGGGKIHRDAFLYLDPRGDKENFAQCSTCVMWTGEKRNTCSILGSTKVTGDMSCCLYVPGPNSPEAKEEPRLTPEEAGLVQREVRCENCIAFQEGTCTLFKSLNEKMPETFELDDQVDAYGCCNAQTPKEEA